MDEATKVLLLAAVDLYGQQENIVTRSELQRKWSRESYSAKVAVSRVSPLKFRSVLTGLGRIVEEKLNELYWVSTVKVGSNEALLIMKIVDGYVSIAACAHEGLIPQHIAKKAVEVVLSRLK